MLEPFVEVLPAPWVLAGEVELPVVEGFVVVLELDVGDAVVEVRLVEAVELVVEPAEVWGAEDVEVSVMIDKVL